MSTELETNIQLALPSALKMALYASTKQQLELRKYALEGVESLCNNAKFVKDLKDEELLQQLEETAKELAVLETQLGCYKADLEKLKPLVESGKLSKKKFDEMLKSSLATPRINAAKHDFYKKFCNSAGIELEMDGDEDMSIQESESMRSTICPVTQGEMEDPLKNPSCGHTYSKKGIQAHLQRSKKCPVAACGDAYRNTSRFYRLPSETILSKFRTRRRNGGDYCTQVRIVFSPLPCSNNVAYLCTYRHPNSEQQRLQGVAAADQNEEDEEEYLVE
ncbi:hypothetical protein PsorP6_004413 [Peronosclerospora sorghi]|uniref:Uncharacterized protein n=1 Tax=Peronosclerospora sorghi TaxID=230839 RepID=A0ACC0VK71_9STRA|nr:hypothetical protein PsorP6_004413 [Peronosclerospora sorghi]